MSPASLDVEKWRASTPEEMVAYFSGKQSPKEGPSGSILVVRKHLRPIDVYAYLRARFGEPNGFQNFLRRDDSDNLIHWDFLLKANGVDVYLAAPSREIQIVVSEKLVDTDWRDLITAIKADFGRVAAEKSKMLRSFEKYFVFQNKFVSLAGLCADLHVEIVDAPPYERPAFSADGEDVKPLEAAMTKVSKRAEKLFRASLLLRLVTPIMVEAYINMVILIFCKDAIRLDRDLYQAFLRTHIPERIALLSENCAGFTRPIDTKTDAYANFMRVVNKRNFALHGNVDPIAERIETIFFEGRRPLFVNPGNNVQTFFEQLEALHAPHEVASEYERIHEFLVEIADCLSEQHRRFFDQVITDAYPGYFVTKHRPTRILPDHVVTGMLPGVRYDDELNVEW